MNTWKDVGGLDSDSRISHDVYSNYRMYLVNNSDWKDYVVDDEDKNNIKDLTKDKGKIVAIAKVKDTYAGNDSYVLFFKKDDKFSFAQYSKLNGLYNEMGPYSSLNTAESNADTYGLFQECVNDVEMQFDPEDYSYVKDGSEIC